MTSKRHTSAASIRVEDDVLLDAARACVLERGMRGTTVSGVARTAGVSRMTLYRRFPDVRSLLAALMTREFGALLARVDERAATTATGRERLVGAAVHSANALASNPLMRTVLDRDAELMLPYIVERMGSVQRIAEQFLQTALIAGRADGSVRAADPAVQARAILLVVQSFVFSLRPATADVDRAALLGELTHLLDAALRPAEEKTP
jgi:AcrR family transcriptional regulator